VKDECFAIQSEGAVVFRVRCQVEWYDYRGREGKQIATTKPLLSLPQTETTQKPWLNWKELVLVTSHTLVSSC